MNNNFDKRKKFVFIFPQLLLSLMFFLLTSCSGSDYLNSIPGESTALISMDVNKMSGINNQTLLKAMFHVSDLSDCGLDLTSKIYFFESADGNLGLCVKVSDEDDLNDLFTNLAKQGVCQQTKERRGFHFTVLKDSWVIGFSDKAMLVMGPATVTAQAELQNQMAKYLKQDEDEGIKGTPIYDKLDSIDSPIAMVTQAQALPEKFVAPFTLGAPKDADASQVYIAADMNVAHGCLNINSEAFSFNKHVDKALKDASKIYRPIKGRYVKSMPSDALVGMFMNVKGVQFLPMLQNNKGMQALLMGINSAIDMDNIIRSVDGDMTIVMPSFAATNLQMSMSAELANANWLGDVDYWKQSCPKGGHISDCGKNFYYYTDGKMTFYFGVSADKQFYSGSSESQAEASIQASKKPIADDLQKQIKGKKMVMVINLSSVKDDKISTLTSFIQPILGKLNSIVYTLK